MTKPYLTLSTTGAPAEATGKMEISLSANTISAPWVQYKLVSYLWCHFLSDSYVSQPSGINSFTTGPNRKTVLKAHRPDLQWISTLYPKRYMTESRVCNTAKCKEWARWQRKCEHEGMGRAGIWSDKPLLSILPLNPWPIKTDVRASGIQDQNLKSNPPFSPSQWVTPEGTRTPSFLQKQSETAGDRS